MERPQSIISGEKAHRPRTCSKEGGEGKHEHAIRPYIAREKKAKRDSKDSRDRQLSSVEMVRCKSKKLEGSGRKSQQMVNKNQQQFIAQLISLRGQYKLLKNCYNELLQAKEIVVQDYHRTQAEVGKAGQQAEQYRKHISIMQQEIERLKRECYKLLDTEKFKNKKLEETIQEKELMIAYLRNQLELLRKNKPKSPNQSALHFLQNSAPIFAYDVNQSMNNVVISATKDIIISTNKDKFNDINKIHEEHSLSFSRQRSKDFQSLHSLLSKNQPQQKQSQPFIKRDLILLSSASQKADSSKIKLKKAKKKGQTEGIKKSRIRTKRLQIMTDQNKDLNQENSMQTKKKGSLISNRVRKLSKKKKR